MKKSTIIGISGGSGSGKTSFIRAIKKAISEENICIISQDDYYKPRETQFIDENGVHNFDLPESIEIPAFVHDIEKLKQGMTVQRQEYTFNNLLAESKIIVFKPAPIIIVEGLFIFHDDALRSQLDLSILIHAKDSDKIIRRILRDQNERNYPIDDVLYRYKHHVMPAYEKYIQPYIDDVDVVINNNDNFDNGLAVVCAYMQSLLIK
jgi:uridine kinase